MAVARNLGCTGETQPTEEGFAWGWDLKTTGAPWAAMLSIWPWTQVLVVLATNQGILIGCLFPCPSLSSSAKWGYYTRITEFKVWVAGSKVSTLSIVPMSALLLNSPHLEDLGKQKS